MADVARVRAALLQVDGDRDFATAVDPVAITAVARPEVATGSLADLDATSAAVSTGFARGQRPGRRVDHHHRLRR